MKNKKWVWTVCMLLGIVLLGGAVALAMHNVREDSSAGESSEEALKELSAVILDNIAPPEAAERDPVFDDPIMTQQALLYPAGSAGAQPLTTVTVRELVYCGVITLPTLNIQLPVQDEWSYPGLQISPCRFYGSPYRNNLVICAHNYNTHFGQIKNLQIGDAVQFTDMEGTTFEYAVAATEVLTPDATAEVASGEWDLTLFTCTIGGRTRVVVRCDRTESGE